MSIINLRFQRVGVVVIMGVVICSVGRSLLGIQFHLFLLFVLALLALVDRVLCVFSNNNA